MKLETYITRIPTSEVINNPKLAIELHKKCNDKGVTIEDITRYYVQNGEGGTRITVTSGYEDFKNGLMICLPMVVFQQQKNQSNRTIKKYTERTN